MKFEYELSRLAQKDLNSIWDYTAEQWSPNQANKYYKYIFSEINKICSNPEIGKSIKDVKDNHRIKAVKSHLVIYKIENGKIFIDRILHQRMDIDNKLTD